MIPRLCLESLHTSMDRPADHEPDSIAHAPLANDLPPLSRRDRALSRQVSILSLRQRYGKPVSLRLRPPFSRTRERGSRSASLPHDGGGGPELEPRLAPAQASVLLPPWTLPSVIPLTRQRLEVVEVNDPWARGRFPCAGAEFMASRWQSALPANPGALEPTRFGPSFYGVVHHAYNVLSSSEQSLWA
jgi:hypothetical protein